MSRDASGNYTLPAGNPVVSGAAISSNTHNTTMTDVATELQDSLSRSGKGGMSQPLKLTDGSAAAPSLTHANETTTGLYRIGAGHIGFALAGVLRASVSTGGLRAYDAAATDSITLGHDGTNATLVGVNTTNLAITGVTAITIGGSTMLTAANFAATMTDVPSKSANAGVIGDFNDYADPGADRIFGWDESANAAIGYTLSTGLTTSGTNLLIDTTVVPRLGVANVFTAANALRADSTGLSVGAGDDLTFYHDGNNSIIRNDTGPLIFQASGAASAFEISSAGNFDFKDGTITTTNASASEVGYKGIPQNNQAGNYTCVLADSNKHIYYTGAGSGAHTFTIHRNAVVAHPVGTTLTFVNFGSSGDLNIAIDTDTMYLAGTLSTGARVLANTGVATALKINSTNWIISGAGLS